jgi:hypothetical protein
MPDKDLQMREMKVVEVDGWMILPLKEDVVDEDEGE